MIDIKKNRIWTTRFVQSQKLDNLPYPNMVVEEIEDHDYRMPQHSPSIIPRSVGGQITLTLAGCGCLQANGKTYSCVPGTAFIYRDCDPFVSYFTDSKSSEKWRFVWINFIGEASESLISTINHSYGYFFDLGENDSLKNKLLSYRSFDGITLQQTPLESAKLVFDLLNLLCARAEHLTLQDSSSRLIRNVQNEISQSFGESISTESLAKKNGISREYLSKLFHEKTGSTLRDYRTEQKMVEAVNLLLKSNFSCKEIALRCHYGSYSSFFRAFVRTFKLSPEEFRLRNPAEDSSSDKS